MNQNPYDSPSAYSSTANASGAERPIGVSILAALHLLGGLFLFILQFALIGRMAEMNDSLQAIGMPPVLLIIGVIFLSVLTLASAVGMWLGTSWGWWLAAFYYMYGIFRNGTGLLTAILLSETIAVDGASAESIMVQQAVRAVIQVLLLMYFFKPNVLAFFGTEDVSKVKAISVLAGICFGILVVTSTISWLTTS